MTANAPYYQMRPQLAPNGTNAPQCTAEADDHRLAVSAIAPEQGPALYPDGQAASASTETPENKHNLAELLQATQAMNADNTGLASHRGKRKRVSSPAGEATGSAGTSTADGPGSARPRVDVDPQLESADSRRSASECSSVPPSGESLLNDARAAGVHSAAALFRRSSKQPSRKYTRPPMSKLFMSLQLTPENFLRLQAQAKSYMLDPAHPERQDCVGNRAKGDTDMVKLRLFNCVRDFLNDGVGEQFFGEHVETPGEADALEAARALGQDRVPAAADRLRWPQDGNKIISLVTPLLRRMVTNERQRMYAIETRKGAKKKESSVELEQTRQPCEPRPTSTSPVSIAPQSALVQAKHSLLSEYATTALNNDMVRAGGEFSVERPNIALRDINLFLLHANINIMERRFSTMTGTNFNQVEWDEIKIEADRMTQTSLASYPQLREQFYGECQSSMGPETLRGLAVAATEIGQAHAKEDDGTKCEEGNGETLQDANHEGDSSSLLMPSRGRRPDTQLHDMATGSAPAVRGIPPPYSVTTMTTKGFKRIQSREDWNEVKSDIGVAHWADGVCNLLVEFDWNAHDASKGQ